MKIIAAKMILKIRRPNGTEEIVDASDRLKVTSELGAKKFFEAAQKQTADAGRGDVYAYEYTPQRVILSEDEEQYNALMSEVNQWKERDRNRHETEDKSYEATGTYGELMTRLSAKYPLGYEMLVAENKKIADEKKAEYANIDALRI